MAMSRSFRSFAVPAAACCALAFAACLDDSMPAAPAVPPAHAAGPATHPAGTAGAAEPGLDKGSPIPFDSMPLRDRFDSSRRALRRLEDKSAGTYFYARLRFMGWPDGPDTTCIGFQEGRAAWREAWYTVDVTPEYPPGQNHIAVAIIAHEHYLESGEVGSHPYGERALPLDSLYAQCEALLPLASDPDFRFSVGPDQVLRECGPVPSHCSGSACFPEIKLASVGWPEVLTLEPGPLPGQ